MEDIKLLSTLDRPREKMIVNGPGALSDTELLAILLGSGTRECPVLTLCTEVLAAYGASLDDLAAAPIDKLCLIKGIGAAKATIIAAAMELGSRRLKAQIKIPRIKNNADAIRLVGPYYKNITERLFILLLLNKNHELLATSELVLTDDLPDIGKITQLTLEAGAAGFGLVRNALDDLPEFRAAENKLVSDLDAATKMLKLKFFGRIVFVDS